MFSTQKTNTPVAAPLNREEACQRHQSKYTDPTPRARKHYQKVSRQTLAAQELLLDLACEDDEFTERYGGRDDIKWSDEILHYIATKLMRKNKICDHLAPSQFEMLKVCEENKCGGCGGDLEDTPARRAIARLIEVLVARGHDEEPTKNRVENWRARADSSTYYFGAPDQSRMITHHTLPGFFRNHPFGNE
jgi:hypothetical protein